MSKDLTSGSSDESDLKSDKYDKPNKDAKVKSTGKLVSTEHKQPMKPAKTEAGKATQDIDKEKQREVQNQQESGKWPIDKDFLPLNEVVFEVKWIRGNLGHLVSLGRGTGVEDIVLISYIELLLRFDKIGVFGMASPNVIAQKGNRRFLTEFLVNQNASKWIPPYESILVLVKKSTNRWLLLEVTPSTGLVSYYDTTPELADFYDTLMSTLKMWLPTDNDFTTHNYEHIGNDLRHEDYFHILLKVEEIIKKANNIPVETGITEQQYRIKVLTALLETTAEGRKLLEMNKDICEYIKQSDVFDGN